CADLIIESQIPRVVIGCIDPNAQVSGKGIKKLQEAGIEVKTGILEAECRALNEHFICYHEKKRPYILLKWAQSRDGFIAPEKGNRVMLSNELSQKRVHELRSVFMGILI